MPYIGRAATNAGSVNYLDDISSGFDGSDTTFTCAISGTTITPGQENVFIYLDGVFQDPGSSKAYTISGSTITFTEAPANGTIFTGYVAGEGAYLDDGTVSTAKLDDDAVTASKLDDDGTGFQVGDLGVGGSLTSGDKLTVTGRLRASGGIIGDITGDVTGNVTGNASGTAATVTGGTQASITSAANLATVGTISTGVWNGTAIASAYLDADTAHLSGTQTFSGAKTFTANPIIQSDTGTLNFYNASGTQRAFLQLSSTGLIIDTDSFLEFKPNNTRALYIDSSLNSTFAGVVTASGSTGSNYIGSFTNTSATGWGLFVKGGADNADYALRVQDKDAGDLLSVKAGGRTGLGTNDPASLLHVKTTANVSETIRIQNDDSLTTVGVSSDGYSFHTYQHSLYLASWDGSTWSTKARWDNNGNLGIGHLSPQFGLTLAQGDTDAQAIGWEDASNTKRASIYTATSDDFLTFNVAGGDRMKLGSNSSNWTLQLTGNSPYGMQITTTASNSSSHDMFVVKRGDGTKCFEIFGDGNVYGVNEFISDSGFRSKGTSGAAPTGDDHHNVPIKMVAYRKTVSSTNVSNGYIDFDTDIYRDNIISGITNHFGAAASNNNNIGYNPGYGHSLHFYAGGACRLYFGGDVVANDKMGIVLFFHGSTG